jgi:hypothetical protein
MENSSSPEKRFDKVAYSREYQKKRYHSDPTFKEKQLSHVKQLYKENRELLNKYKEELKHKEISNVIV